MPTRKNLRTFLTSVAAEPRNAAVIAKFLLLASHISVSPDRRHSTTITRLYLCAIAAAYHCDKSWILSNVTPWSNVTVGGTHHARDARRTTVLHLATMNLWLLRSFKQVHRINCKAPHCLQGCASLLLVER